MNLEDLKGVVAIGGGAAGVLLVVMLLLRLTPAWTKAVAGSGKPLSRTTVALLAAALLIGGVLALWTNSFIGPLLLFQAGQAFTTAANTARARGRLLMAIGIAIQAAAALSAAFILYRHNGADLFKFVLPPALLAAVCLGLLLRPPERPAWLKVGLPALLAVGVVSVLATLNHQWPMTALWLGLASGPLAVAWLRAKSPAPTDTTLPPAMEPTA
jgi:hypothetical protein